jgi:peptidoglycan/LPS O-acetylase OafA/YrhL
MGLVQTRAIQMEAVALQAECLKSGKISVRRRLFDRLCDNQPPLSEFLAAAWVAYFALRMPKINRAVGSLALGWDWQDFCWAPFLAIRAAGSDRVGRTERSLGCRIGGPRTGSALSILVSSSFMGDSSYSLYLLHILLLDCFFLTVGFYFSSSVNPLVLAVLLTIVSVVISQLAYSHVERHLTTAARQIMRP